MLITKIFFSARTSTHIGKKNSLKLSTEKDINECKLLRSMNQPKLVKKDGTTIFVDSLLRSAQETKQVKPQTRYDQVDEKELEKTMASLQKGMIRRK